MQRNEEDPFLREKKKQDPVASLYRIAALGLVTVFAGLLIFLVGSLSKEKKQTDSDGIRIMTATEPPKAGEQAYSVSAAAVPAEKTETPPAQVIEVAPITRETEEDEEPWGWEEEPEPTKKKSSKKTPAPTDKPEKTPKSGKKTAEPDPETEEEGDFDARSILFEDEEELIPEEEPEEEAAPTPKPTATPEPTPEPTPKYGTLSRHDQSPKVTELQMRLMELGYLDIDEPTDYFGKVTENAVRLFQRQHGLSVDGTAGQETQTALYASAAQKYCLMIGTEGGDVKMLQQQLCELGYLEEKAIDSVYGETTVRAVKAFQERNGLSADGLAGEKTLEVLYSEEAKISYSAYKAQRAAEASASAAAAKKKKATPKPTATPKKETRVDKFLAAARSKLGCEYVLGDCGPKTFDCSGFVYWCLRQAGVSVTRLNAAGFSNKSGWKKITKIADLEAGDILFYRSDTNSHVNHCGIYVGGGNMIDASSGNGKVIKRALSAYWKRNFVCARRPW